MTAGELPKKIKSQVDILHIQVELNKNLEGEASARNINEGDCSGSLNSVVNALKAKMKKEEIDILRKENHQLKLDNVDLTQRLNNQVHCS